MDQPALGLEPKSFMDCQSMRTTNHKNYTKLVTYKDDNFVKPNWAHNLLE